MDAASSGSDDASSSEGSESSYPEIGRKTGEDAQGHNDDSSSEEEEDAGRNPEEDSDSESDDDHEEDDEEDEAAPLAERIRRQSEQGISLKGPRERKSRARKIASERLAQLRNEKKTNEQSKSLESSTSNGVAVSGDRKKTKSKHAPTEASSKRADFYRRTPQLNESGIGVDIGAHKYKPRDPRVESLSGHLDVQHYEHNYEFLQDMRLKEVATLRKNIAARKAPGRNGQNRRRRMGLTNDGGSLEADQEELKRLTQEKADVERAQVDRAAKQTVKKKLHADVAEGKHGAYFLKRKDMKRLHLEAKYEEIRKRGGDRAVDKVVAKRRKKNKSKDAGLLGKGIPSNYNTGGSAGMNTK